jgi:hypothetical protein
MSSENAVNNAGSFPFHSSSAQFIRQKADRTKRLEEEKKGKAKQHKNKRKIMI